MDHGHDTSVSSQSLSTFTLDGGSLRPGCVLACRVGSGLRACQGVKLRVQGLGFRV